MLDPASVHQAQIQHVSIYNSYNINFFFFCGTVTQRGSWPPNSWGLLDHTRWRTTVGRNPLDEWSARCRDLYLTTHNTHNRQHIQAPGGIRTHDLSRRAAADLRLRPRGHWNQHNINYLVHFSIFVIPVTLLKNCQWGWVPFWFSILCINILLELETDSSHQCIWEQQWHNGRALAHMAACNIQSWDSIFSKN
jgi:hypothetical protein